MNEFGLERRPTALGTGGVSAKLEGKCTAAHLEGLDISNPILSSLSIDGGINACRKMCVCGRLVG